MPFIAKAYDEPYVNYATKVMLGAKKVKDFNFNPRKHGYAIKIPVFSYDRIPRSKQEELSVQKWRAQVKPFTLLII